MVMENLHSISSYGCVIRVITRNGFSGLPIKNPALSLARHVGVRIGAEVLSALLVTVGLVEETVQALGGLLVFAAGYLPLGEKWQEGCGRCLEGRIKGVKESAYSAVVNFGLLFTNPFDGADEKWGKKIMTSVGEFPVKKMLDYDCAAILSRSMRRSERDSADALLSSPFQDAGL